MSTTPDFIHKFIPGTSGRTLLLLHGTGGNESDLLPLGRALDPAAALLSPRGKILEHGMPRFFRRLAEGVFDEKDLILRTHELADFIAAAAVKYGFDPKQLIAVGYSNGANIAASTLLLRPGTLAGAALLRGMVPRWSRKPRRNSTARPCCWSPAGTTRSFRSRMQSASPKCSAERERT